MFLLCFGCLGRCYGLEVWWCSWGLSDGRYVCVVVFLVVWFFVRLGWLGVFVGVFGLVVGWVVCCVCCWCFLGSWVGRVCCCIWLVVVCWWYGGFGLFWLWCDCFVGVLGIVWGSCLVGIGCLWWVMFGFVVVRRMLVWCWVCVVGWDWFGRGRWMRYCELCWCVCFLGCVVVVLEWVFWRLLVLVGWFWCWFVRYWWWCLGVYWDWLVFWFGLGLGGGLVVWIWLSVVGCWISVC